MKKIHLKIRRDVQTTLIEVTASSSDVADEEQFFLAQTNDEGQTEEQTLERREQYRQIATELVGNEELSLLKLNLKELMTIDGNSTLYTINVTKAKARIRMKQDVILVLKILKLEILGQPHDEVLLTKHSHFKRNQASENPIILKENPLVLNYYGETGSVRNHQFLIPKEIAEEPARRVWNAPQNYKDKNRVQTENLLAKHDSADQKVGHVIRANHKDRQKQYVIFHEWSQSKSTQKE